MSLTVNLYYNGKNGDARKFAQEMEDKVLQVVFVPKKAMKNMITLSQWTTLRRFY